MDVNDLQVVTPRQIRIAESSHVSDRTGRKRGCAGDEERQLVLRRDELDQSTFEVLERVVVGSSDSVVFRLSGGVRHS